MKKQLVIGYGNPLRRDDGVAHQVIERLRGEMPSPALELVICHQLTPELVERLHDVGRVILVDAREGRHAGEILVEQVFPTEAFGAFTHNVTPSSLLASALEWYDVRPQCYIVSITGADFSIGEGLSEAVAAAVPLATSVVGRLCTQTEEAVS